MGSFLIGTGVTLVTFYIALIYGSIAIGLIGFAELVLMLLACLYLLIYCRHITADIRIPLTVAEKREKSYHTAYGGSDHVVSGSKSALPCAL